MQHKIWHRCGAVRNMHHPPKKKRKSHSANQSSVGRVPTAGGQDGDSCSQIDPPGAQLLRATPPTREKNTAGPSPPFHTHPHDLKPQGLLGLACQVPAGTQEHTPPW